MWFDGAVSFEPRIHLPHTDLSVGRIGLGSSFGVGADGLEIAYDHGINFFYWGSVRRPGFGQGVRRLARRGRENIAVAVQSYARWPGALMRQSVEAAIWRLGLDYADVLILGWHNRRPLRSILDTALELREQGRVLSPRDLVTEVWGPEYAEETGYVRRYVWHLRRKLEPDPAHPRYILNERNIGYVFPEDAATDAGS